MRVAVLSGGRSSEHEVSLRSGASVAEGLRDAGHEPVPVLIERDGRWSQDGEAVRLVPGDGLLGCEAAFPALHGPFGEDGTVQGLLEALDVPYVGADVLASALCIDKLSFKRLLEATGIPQVEFVQAGEPGWRDRAGSLGLPLWVKPSRLGSSVGITKVTSPEKGLDEAIELAARHDPRVIIEASAEGREVECSVLGNEDPQTSQPGEIVAHADWYDYEAKYTEGGMELVVPAPLPEPILQRVRELAARVFELAGCSGLARCDFFVIDERVLVNEINTMPGFTETSVYAKLFEASGIDYPSLCDRLVKLGIDRYERARSFEF
jgi:D-alanine-D-alanine ligase